MGEESRTNTGEIPIAAAVALRSAAVALALLALRWVYLYVFTDYRQHLAAYYLAAAALVLAIAVGLWLRLKSVAVLSAVAAIACIGVSIWLLANGAFTNPFVWAAAVLSAAYVGALAKYLLENVRVRR